MCVCVRVRVRVFVNPSNWGHTYIHTPNNTGLLSQPRTDFQSWVHKWLKIRIFPFQFLVYHLRHCPRLVKIFSISKSVLYTHSYTLPTLLTVTPSGSLNLDDPWWHYMDWTNHERPCHRVPSCVVCVYANLICNLIELSHKSHTCSHV